MNKHYLILISTILCLMVPINSYSSVHDIILCCKENNDLYLTLKENKISCQRYYTPNEAIDNAAEGSGVMILADNYPEQTTEMNASLFEKAKHKKLRLYIEYPSYIPGVKIDDPRGTHWERAVVSSDAFAPELQKLSILAIHDCRYIPVDIENPDIVIARVAGYDNALYGLPEEKFPVLVQPKGGDHGALMVSTTKLSQFITARYAPSEAWPAVWKYIFTWLQPGKKAPKLKWTANVRPTYGIDEPLAYDAERQALKRGIDWYSKSRMLVSSPMMGIYDKTSDGEDISSSDHDWHSGNRITMLPDKAPAGDGSFGVLEGYNSKIYQNGEQPAIWWRRSDCNGEVAGAMAIAGTVFQNPEYTKISNNIVDWLYFNSLMSVGDRAKPAHPAYGLIGWNDVPQYTGPGSMNGYEVYYGDDQARTLLGTILAGAALKTDRFDERLMKGLMANLRLTGQLGFQPDRIDQQDLVKNGIEYYQGLNSASYSGNFQAYLWACYLWAYQQTGYDLFLKQAKAGISTMMAGYPRKWGTIGIQMDRSRMILPLAWLVRVEDTQQHRSWLRMIVEDLKPDIKTGTIADRIEPETSNFGGGHYRTPKSNEEYGTAEAPIIQRDGDPSSDMLYAVNFAFLGIREAAAVTGDQYYKDAEDKLAQFLTRIQIRSEARPELDGGWFRAFDFKRWEYWASSADGGWGAWSIETGWSQSWITITLALRQLNTSFWDITRDSNIKKHFENVKQQMFPIE